MGVFLNNKIVNVNLVGNYIGEIWQDELNTRKLQDYTTVDLSFQKEIKNLNFTVDIQNIMDIRFIDKKGGLSPGRFIMIEISYQF